MHFQALALVLSIATSLIVHAQSIAPSGAIIYTLPRSIPANASQQLAAAPVGISFEFFTFPDYFDTVPATNQCLQNLRDVSGTWPPIRIGGTTQDRATYDSASTDAVTYTVASTLEAPASLTFGSRFLELAGIYKGQIILGLNRRLNNITTTIQAAARAIAVIPNLNAMEVGNEPNFYSSSDPIAGGSWSASKDRSSQTYWQNEIASSLGKSNFVSAGVYFGTSFSIQALVPAEGAALSIVKNFCSHNYPQGGGNYDLARLMSHSAGKSQVSGFAAEYRAAAAVKKPYIFGETNSATQGGGGISPTFGAALWIVDYVMQSILIGVKELYFHQGTIGNCQYCWWGRYSMGAPYYGAYFATMALAGASQIAPLDDSTTNYAGYAIYTGNQITKVLLYNSNYYDGTGPRSSKVFAIRELSGCSVITARRLTAASAISRQDRGQNPTVAGQTFANGTCTIQGPAVTETATVSAGTALFTLAASEALLVYL